MGKASPGRTSFNAGEFSELVQGRVDLDRYGASMRKMLNFVSVPQGPALRRSGTQFVTPNRDENFVSGFVPFEFSDTQVNMLEFNEGVMRVLSEDGVLLGPGGGPYEIRTPYGGDAVRRIRYVQSDDVMYLFCDGYRVQKLARYGATDWRMSEVVFRNGPFMPIIEKQGLLSFSGRGSAVPTMSSNTAPSGVASDNQGSASAFYAFDGNPATQVALQHGGYLQYEFPTPRIITGYIIGAPNGYANEQGISAMDTAPYNFYVEGSNDGAVFAVLDRQFGYVNYDNGQSVHITFENAQAYKFYRFVALETRRPGVLTHFTELVYTEPDGTQLINARLDGQPVAQFNQGRGFLGTDTGRLLRIRSQRGVWSLVRIVEVKSARDIVLAILGAPLGDGAPTTEWQAGYFCDTIGQPTVGVFFEDRLWLSGVAGAPTLVVGSRVGDYENFEARTSTNEVLDDSALVLLLKARKQSRVQWLESDEKGLLAGTGSSEWVISNGGATEAFNAKNGRARSSTERGSANVTPVKVDRQVLYVQKSRRTIREFAYVFDADGYKSPSMSLFASHLGVKSFEQLAYTAEPHSIVWVRREDGSIVALTYNREENVIGWSQHDFGGVVESIASLPSRDGRHDTLWISIRRSVGGLQRRFIERLTRFWDFDSELNVAHFVDSGLRYAGSPVSSVGGLSHLEGQAVHGLADGVPFAARVQSARVTLPKAASDVVVGIPYESFGEISRLEAGAADGTALGKVKRIHNASVAVWSSTGGEIGIYNEDSKEYDWNRIEYPEPYDELENPGTKTAITGPHIVGGGYGKDGTLAFRQLEPLPFNVVAILPQMNTQDR